MSDTSAGLAIAGVTNAEVSIRYGIKGPTAAKWLAEHAIAVPARANSVSRWDGGRCLRLGNTEFLVEHDVPDAASGNATDGDADVSASAVSDDGAWRLLRSDCSILLDHDLWPATLAQACSFDFTRLRDEPDLIVMTLFAGISVTVIREQPDIPAYGLRLWCDATFATYLHECLQQLAATRPSGEQR
jgi:sarcosine oxidase, subunit gamma